MQKNGKKWPSKEDKCKNVTDCDMIMTQRDNYSLLSEVKYRNRMKCKQTTTSTIYVLRKQVFHILELTYIFIGNLLQFPLIFTTLMNLVSTFSWPPTCDTRNYQLLVICHARSNVTSLNRSFKKRSKHKKKITNLC